MLGGLAVGLGFKAGLFNIGAQGQFLMGALGSVAVGVAVASWPPILAIPIAVLAGFVAGCLYGFVPGFLKAVSGAHEVVTTIMMNYIAIAVLAAMVSGPLKVPGSPSPITHDVGLAAYPVLIGRNGHLGILVALAAVAVAESSCRKLSAVRSAVSTGRAGPSMRHTSAPGASAAPSVACQVSRIDGSSWWKQASTQGRPHSTAASWLTIRPRTRCSCGTSVAVRSPLPISSPSAAAT